MLKVWLKFRVIHGWNHPALEIIVLLSMAAKYFKGTALY